MMGGTLVFSSVVDPEKWDAAGWLGLAYLEPFGTSSTPGIAFIFKNRAPAIDIFKDWRERVGADDVHDEIRLAMIAKTDTYVVHVGTNVDRAAARAQATQQPSGRLHLASLSRIHELPQSGSLAAFRKNYASAGRYLVLPAIHNAAAPFPDLVPELIIQKRQLVFRNAQDVRPDDIDAVALGRQKTGN